jgi:hypothetical protein
VAHPGHRHIYNQYTIRAARRAQLLAHHRASGVGTEFY